MPDEKYDKARKQRNRKYLILFLSVFVSALLVILYVSEEWDHEAADHGRPLRVSPTKSKQQPQQIEQQKQQLAPVQPAFDIDKLEQTVQELDAQVRTIKSTGVIMETDPESLKATKALQEATRKLLHARYGTREPYRVKAILQFQKQSPDFVTNVVGSERGSGEFLFGCQTTSFGSHFQSKIKQCLVASITVARGIGNAALRLSSQLIAPFTVIIFNSVFHALLSQLATYRSRSCARCARKTARTSIKHHQHRFYYYCCIRAARMGFPWFAR